ncbi:MAG: hypothetical protein A2X86_03055 [Bdellovibrionales bacterium GWA2_49_15]|nr:MAG: hypothetical protein A2X86_03055 [Bdellovibrionales bacterium GWA2_49_15]HAZ12192.1 hypothetical protein [Bdellovibrionales bacterium]
MKKLISVIALVASAQVFASGNNDLADYKGEMKISEENIAALESARSENKMMGGWECEARGIDGAVGVGQGLARAQAAMIALNFCRGYSFQPFSCQVISCFPLQY